MPVYGYIFICFYALICFIVIFMCKVRETNLKKKKLSSSTIKCPYNLTILEIFIISLLFVALDILLTENNPPLSSDNGDRYNYLVEYMGLRNTSQGLDFIFNIFRFFDADFSIAIYFICFICIFVTFYMYRIWLRADTHTVVVLMAVGIYFTVFVNLKQCFANTLAIIVFYYLIEKESNLINNLICIVLIYLACIFHSVGYLLILLFIYFRLLKFLSKKFYFSLFLFCICVVFFVPMVKYLGGLLSFIAPSIATKINAYFTEGGASYDTNFYWIFLKGFPFYVLIFVAIVKRKEIAIVEKTYDNFLILATCGSLLYFCSIFSYWMSRWVDMFYFPIGILFSILMKNASKNQKLIFYLVIIGSMFFFNFRNMILSFINYGGI